MGLDLLPGVLTLLGAIFALGGIFFIDRGSRERLANEAKDMDNSYLEDFSQGRSLFNQTLQNSEVHSYSYSFNGTRLSGR